MVPSSHLFVAMTDDYGVTGVRGVGGNWGGLGDP